MTGLHFSRFPASTLKILGKTSREVEAHIDFAASKTIIPPYIAEELGLRFAGFESVATGAGVILMPEYEATVEAFDERHRILVGCLELPRESPIEALQNRRPKGSQQGFLAGVGLGAMRGVDADIFFLRPLRG